MKQEIIDKFIDFYGEEFLDISDNYIIIWYPEVIISNENDLSHLMRDLYVKVSFNKDEFDKFELLRGTLTINEMQSGYAHSHLSGINTNFHTSCLGRGPINNTIASLKTTNEYLELWDLFIVELDKYVRVESLAGTPYNYINNIKSKGSYDKFDTFYSIQKLPYKDSNLINWIRGLSNNIYDLLNVNFNCGQYQIGYNYSETILILTKHFLKYIQDNNLNINGLEDGILKKGFYHIDCVEMHKNVVIDSKDKNKYLFSFKGEEIYLKIIDIEPEGKDVPILNKDITDYIVTSVLTDLNLFKNGIDKTAKFI